MTAAEVKALKAEGYNPWDYYQNSAELKAVIDSLKAGDFSHGNSDLFMPLIDSLLSWDNYLLLADYQSYADCQEQVSQTYRDRDRWTRMSILNAARMGKFSSDRSITQYAEEIWKTPPVKIELTDNARLSRNITQDVQLQ
ncbi:MAG: glycogen/starch/alpha-glucan phosphorylase [Leptolyngbyaceae cyanobacterium SM1_1_3]|nr:glycogen/starch/alpha-glucan phosphorylase [Leptolyngbyaceae cyanobacterium SM1_1_3]